MVMWLTGLALAQGLPEDTGYTVPDFDADQYRPLVEARHTLATEDSLVLDGFAASAELGWAHGLLFFEYDDGEVVGLVTDAAVAHLGAAWGTGRLRVGALAPLVLWTASDVEGRRTTALGDLELDAKVLLWQGEHHGVATYGRLSLPLGAADHQLGHAGPGLEAGGVADVEWRGLHIALNAAYQRMPKTELGELTLSSLLVWRAAVSFGLERGPRLTGELLARNRPGRFLQADGGTGLETLGSVHLSVRGVPVRVGAGLGLMPGVGVPTWRLIVGLGHRSAE